MPDQHISITEIASQLGVSVAAVSYALRGKRGVSDKLRQRIIDYANQHGYQPDPVNAELMSLVRANKKLHKSGNTIAYINTYSIPALVEQESLFCQGARARAEEFGYEMEVFMARTPGMTGARLTQILMARGIRGVLIGTRFRDDPELVLDWSQFSTVLIGEAEYGQDVHRVCNHQIRSCNQVLHKLTEKGYRHIGLVISERYEISRGYAFSLGADRFGRETCNRDAVPVYYIKPTSLDREHLYKWCVSQKLDAIISLDRNTGCAVEQWHAEGRLPLGYACLNVLPTSRLTSDYASTQHLWSGIDQHFDEIGSTAMEYLRSLLLSGERGVTPHAKTILVNGNWVEGKTTPGPGVRFKL